MSGENIWSGKDQGICQVLSKVKSHFTDIILFIRVNFETAESGEKI